MAKVKQATIKLEDLEGNVQEYKSGKIMARTTRDIMKMYSEMEQVDENGNPTVSEIDSLDAMIGIVADSIFKRVDEVNYDSILDGIPGDELTDTLQNVIMDAMGIDEADIKEAEEGK